LITRSRTDAWLAPHSGRRGRVYSQADFCVATGNPISFSQTAPALCHSHPHWQRTESHNRGFFKNALHIAHDLIHIVLTHLYCADCSKTVSPQASCVFSDKPVFVVQLQARRRRQFPNALFLVFSVGSGRTTWGMAPACGARDRVNGTAVPNGITFRPFSTNLDSYKFGRAGGWALQRVVTRLMDHGSTPSPPVQRECRTHLLYGRFGLNRAISCHP
jgi:hypothetical protein